MPSAPPWYFSLLFSPLLRVPFLCSRITLSLPISEEPKVDAGPSVVLTAGSHSRRLAVRGDAETVGSWQPPPVCRAGDVLSRPLSVGKASRQVSSPMAIRNGHGKSCGGDGEKNLMRPLRKSSPIRKPRLTTNELLPLRIFFHPETTVDNQWIETSAKIFPHPETTVDNQWIATSANFFPSGNHGW